MKHLTEDDLKARIKEYEDLLNKHLSDDPGDITLNDVLENKDRLSHFITEFNRVNPLKDRYKGK